MSPPAELLSRLGGSIQELQRVRFEVPEDESAVARGALFAPRLARRLDEALALVEATYAHYERAAAAAAAAMADDETLEEIGELISSEIAGQEIVDLLYMARAQLAAARQDLLAAIDQEEFLRVTSSCDSGLRTLRRTLVAVESAIHEFEGLPAPVRPWPDLEISLRTRQVYAELRRDVLGRPEPRDRDLADRLAGVHDRLAQLRELDVYPMLRFDDRVAMRELRRRVARWVTAEEPDLVAGRRLWQDLAGFAGLIGGVSHRQELRQHDRALLRRTYHALFGRAAHPAALSDDQLQQLQALRGLDEELDALLEARERRDLPRWQGVLARLLHRLSGPAENVAAGAPWIEPA